MWRNLQSWLGREGWRCHTPTVLQMEAVECGAAALGIILSYYDRVVPLAELRQVCGVSRDGVSAFNITQAAKEYDLDAKSFRTNLSVLQQLKRPYIVFWNFNHFLVVEGYRNQRVYLNDPATGPRSVSLEEFSGAYTGVLILLEPGAEFKPGGSKRGVASALWSRLSDSTGVLIYALIAGFLLVIPGLAIPTFTQIFVDDILIQGRSEWLRPLILGIIITALLNGFLTLLQLQFLRRMKIKLVVGMTSRFIWHLLRLPIGFYEQRFAGEISSRVQLNDSIANLLSGKLATTVIAAVTIVVYAIVMLQYDAVLTVIAIAFVATNLAVLQWIRRQRVDANIKLIQEYGKVSGVGISGLQSMETLKASGLEADFFARWAGHYALAINARQDLEVTNQTIIVLPIFLSAIAQLLILAVGGWRVMDGAISIGMLVAFQGMMQRFLEPVNNLVSLGSELQEMEGNLDRLDDVLDNPVDPQLEQGDNAQPTTPLLRLQGNIEFRNVTFGYSRVAPPVIEDFTLKLQPGQRVALVGGSGSGKSTIAKLLCGLYEPWSGEILLDGSPRQQIKRTVLATSLASVEQDISLFAGSIRENLTLWDATVPDSSLVSACTDAALHDVILSLPGGYDADLSENATNLSGGQRQQLEIARALVNNPAILVMDEATSALDAETEKKVAHNLRLRGCSCMIVAHRLSTIRDCDRILVLEGGKVVQQGTHDELKQIEGTYQHLLRSEETPEVQAAMGTGMVLQSSDRHPTPDAEAAELASNLINIPGQSYCLNLNQSLLLDEQQTVWVVKSGNLALFASARSQGMRSGSRRYLFNTQSGQAMFAALTQPDQQHRLEAVAMEETELLKLAIEDFSQFFAEMKDEATALIEGWIDQIGTAAIAPPSSTMPILTEPTPDVFLMRDQIFQPRQRVAWVQVQTGRANWMGFEQLPLTPASKLLPLAPAMWVQAEETVELNCTKTAEMQNATLIFNGLAQLYAYFLDGIEQRQQRELEAEFLRLQAQEQLERQMMQETMRDLVSVLLPPGASPPNTPEFNSDALIESERALLIATGAIGRMLGIEIRPPAKSFNSKRAQDPVEAIARASQIRIRQIKLQDDWWNQGCTPMLAYLKDKHPVALLPVSSTRYDIFEPLNQTQTPVNASTAAALTSTAYVFYPPLPKNPNPLSLFTFAVRGHHKEIAVVVLTGIAVALLGMVTPQAIAILIDKAIPDGDRGLLLQLAFGLAAAAFGGMLFQLAQGLALIRLETFADAAIQVAVWDRLLNLKADFFRAYSVGDLNARASAISQIRRLVGSTVLRTISSSLFSLLNLGLLFYYSARLALVASGVALLISIITIVSGILTVRKVYPLLEQAGQLFGVMVSLINSAAKLRVAKAETRAFAFWGKQYAEQLKLVLSTQGIEDFLTVVNQILPALTTAALFWVAASSIGQSSADGLSTGTFLAFNAAFGTFIAAITSLNITVIEVLQVLPFWKRAEPIVFAQPEINLTKADPGRLVGSLALERVSFRYAEAGALVLDDVSIHAQTGEFIAIVGPTGSGKSTLLRLLLGFESPDAGNVYYDGQDLSELDLHAVRRQLGVVLQQSRLMSDSIFKNIAGGALITIDEAWEAARLAGLADEIAEMPMQMHTIVSEAGSNLSGGQRQRLLIARALVLQPRILLFDEATSALDNRTQAIVSQSLEQIQVTRIAIAHRLSTIRHADRIYVLQDSKVVQHGNFQQLADQPGLFAQLMQRQML